MAETQDADKEPGAEKFAALVYTPKQTDPTVLPGFVAALKSDEVRVAGILQESRVLPGDTMRTMYSIDIATGTRIPIKRPMANEKDCGLDTSKLVETSAILRRALSERADLVVIEKFGEQEQTGGGLLDEIMQIIIAGIPLMITVPEPALGIWREHCGGMGATLPLKPGEIRDWWDELEGNGNGQIS